MESQEENPPTVITSNPTGVPGLVSHRSPTLDSTANSSDCEGDNGSQSGLRNRRAPAFFRGVYNRIRVAAYLSHARRARPGNEAEPDVHTVLGEERIPLSGMKRLVSRQDSTLAPTDLNPRAQNYGHQQSNKSSKSSQQQPLAASSHSTARSGPNVQHDDNMTTTVNTSTTRNYTLAKGSIHFWRNFAFETEVSFPIILAFALLETYSNYCNPLLPRDILS